MKVVKRFFKGNSVWSKVTRVILLMISGVLFFCFLFVLMIWAGLFGRLPDRQQLLEIQNPQASEVYSSDSVLLGRYFVQERSDINYKDIPTSLKNALMATEDIRFYEHHGIDYRSLGRVLVKSLLLQNESSGGGSTITQQLAKNLFPRKDYKYLSLPINKVREMIIAWRLENLYSKNDILVLYLNTIPFADNTYGIKTAAERFFSTDVRSLTWSQSAVLVGMLKATYYYNPRVYPERALKRRNVVLSQVSKYGHITEEQKETFQRSTLGLKYNNEKNQVNNFAGYFRAHLQQYLLKWTKENKKQNGDPYNLYIDGLKVYTTIDSRVQKYAEQAVTSQMKILQAKFKGQAGRKQLEKLTRQKIKYLPLYKKLQDEGLSENEIINKLKAPKRVKVFTWEGEKELNMSIYDSVRHHVQFLQTGVLAMNPNSGDVLAWVGGINHQYFKFDHVRESTKRQIGSTFKPIVYAAALESGIDPCAYISARKTVYTNMDGWTPENTNEDSYEKKYSMKGGLTKSVNTVSVKLIEQTGVEKTIQLARKFGISSKLPAVPSIALGTASISVQEMVAAYSVFANNGIYRKPFMILAITDKKGKILQEFRRDEGKRVLSSQSARIMVEMLKNVIAEGTASSLRSTYGLTNDIAGKTGTTQSNVDGWFISISPKIVIGAWVGADDPSMHFQSTALGQGASTALPIVAKFYQKANGDPELRQMTYSKFPAPDSYLLSRLDCASEKSDVNFLEKIFGRKEVKEKKFKAKKRKNKGIFARRRD